MQYLKTFLHYYVLFFKESARTKSIYAVILSSFIAGIGITAVIGILIGIEPIETTLFRSFITLLIFLIPILLYPAITILRRYFQGDPKIVRTGYAVPLSLFDDSDMPMPFLLSTELLAKMMNLEKDGLVSLTTSTGDYPEDAIFRDTIWVHFRNKQHYLFYRLSN